MDNNYSIRAYKKGDEEGIISLFFVAFHKKIDVEYWRWKFCRLDTVYSFVIESSLDKKIVGYVGAIPLEGSYNNQQIPCFQMCDVMIHPEARGGLSSHNLFVQAFKKTIESILQKHNNAFCFGYPGKRILTLAQRARIYGNVEQAHMYELASKKQRLRLIQMRQLQWTDKRIDKIWKKLESQYKLVINRDQSYLNWRYASHPCNRYVNIIFTQSQGISLFR